MMGTCLRVTNGCNFYLLHHICIVGNKIHCNEDLALLEMLPPIVAVAVFETFTFMQLSCDWKHYSKYRTLMSKHDINGEDKS